jgi:hypothetical protein
MEILKIEDDIAKYWKNGGYFDIKEIDRDDLLAILIKLYSNDDTIIVDSKARAEDIKDPAARIIFENILSKLRDFGAKRDELKNNIESIFREAEDQYKDDLKDED